MVQANARSVSLSTSESAEALFTQLVGSHLKSCGLRWKETLASGAAMGNMAAPGLVRSSPGGRQSSLAHACNAESGFGAFRAKVDRTGKFVQEESQEDSEMQCVDDGQRPEELAFERALAR